jgi:hypothetical protein
VIFAGHIGGDLDFLFNVPRNLFGGVEIDCVVFVARRVAIIFHNYAGLDTYGLTRTGRWKDPDSADRYNHTMASPEAMRADLLPVWTASKSERKREAG